MVEKDIGSCILSFFKALLPGFTKKLVIPNAVSQHILKEECNATAASLVSPNGTSWHVHVYTENMREKMYFGGEGWLQFVHAHNLGLGYFLVFCYEGNMMFSFRVYDLSSCEMTPYASIELNKEDVKEEETKSFQEKKQKFSKVKFDECTLEKKVEVLKERIEVHKRSDKSSCESLMKDSRYRTRKNKWSSRGGKARFDATIVPCNLSSSYLNIPWRFSDANGLTELSEATLKDPKGRAWHVRLLHRRKQFGNARNSSSIVTGWDKFAAAKKLEVGDTCIFELATKGDEDIVVIHVRVRK